MMARSARIKAAHADFSNLKESSRAALPRICLVTSEFVGLYRNGGLGTSMTGLVEFMAANGADVTVLYSGETAGDITDWKEKYGNAGITLLSLSDFEKPALVGPLPRIGWTNAWHIYQILKDRSFDVIHFNDTMGEGAYCFLAKRLGLAFRNSLLTLAIHSPTEWILESNGHPSDWMGFSCFSGAERLSIANTDLLWGPSRYLLDWIVERGYPQPALVFNQQYVIPTADLYTSGREKIEKVARPIERVPLRKPTEIVFFGRLEERKGIRLFVNTITKLGPELERRGVSVLFMGKPSSVNGINADEYLSKRSSEWRFKWRIESGFDQQQAVTYLRNTNCVAVMASPVDNSPCTVYEALQFGLPFMAARTGGIPELVAANDQKNHLFDYSIASLSKLLLKALDSGISNASPAISVAENQRRWLAMHKNWRNFLPPSAPKSKQKTRFTLFVEHAGTAEALDRSIASARVALGNALERVVILQQDLAKLPDLQGKETQVIDQLSDMTGSEIFSVLAAKPETRIIMLRSGVTIDPQAGAVLSAELGADLCMPFARIAGTTSVMPVLPSSGALVYLEGDYDSGCLVLDAGRVAERLSRTVSRLDRLAPYLGLIEQILGAGGEVWPIPAVLVEAEKGEDLMLPMAAYEAKRSWAMTQMRRLDLHQALSVGRKHYRNIWVPTAPEPSPSVGKTVFNAVNKVVGLQQPENRQRVAKLIHMIFGKRAPLVIARLTSWLR